MPDFHARAIERFEAPIANSLQAIIHQESLTKRHIVYTKDQPVRTYDIHSITFVIVFILPGAGFGPVVRAESLRISTERLKPNLNGPYRFVKGFATLLLLLIQQQPLFFQRA
ncbi:hypothetical protein [Pseudomonas syringae]